MASVKDRTTKPRNTRRERVEHREEKILSAAREMFNECGYGKTTIAEIARRSGVADGTVYLYFHNKEALARGVLVHFYAELTQAAQKGVDALSNSEERLRFLATHHLQTILAHWRLLEVLPLTDLTMDNYEGSTLHQMHKDYTAVFDRVAKDGVSQNILRTEMALWVLRDIFFGAMDYGARTIMIKRQNGHVETFVDDLMKLILAPTETANISTPLEALTQRMETAVERLETATSDKAPSMSTS